MSREKPFSYLHLLLLLLPVASLSMALVLPHAVHAPAPPAYSFIRTDLNVIENEVRGMKGFYEQLYRLEKKEISIQADGFSGKLRMALHQRFGARGRGLVFPYSVANTTSPPDIRSYSNASWLARRNIYTEGPLPSGLSGITMRTTQNFNLNLSITGNDRGIDYEFDQVTLFSEKGPQNFEISAFVKETPSIQPIAVTRSPESHIVQSGESLTIIAAKFGCTVRNLQEWNQLADETIYTGQRLAIKSAASAVAVPVSATRGRRYPFFDNRYSHYSSSVVLDYPVNAIALQGERSSPQQVQSMIYGLVLENTRNTGVLYHTIGVNGAKYEHFNASKLFIEQISELTPDLIIISLGTNEAMIGGFSPGSLYRQVDQFIASLERNMPHASILITTPPDTYLAKKYVNPNGTRAKDLLFNYSMNNDLACWNLFDIMGGEGAIDLWYRNGLAQNDRVHFTWKGYGLQGDLLFEALMNGYGAFQSYRPHRVVTGPLYLQPTRTPSLSYRTVPVFFPGFSRGVHPGREKEKPAGQLCGPVFAVFLLQIQRLLLFSDHLFHADRLLHRAVAAPKRRQGQAKAPAAPEYGRQPGPAGLF